MGKHKKYTPRAFEKAVAAYFASICYVEPVVQTVPVLEELPDGTQRVKLDRNGHQMFTFAAVKTADGKGATRLCYTEPPSVTGICLRLGISRDTWASYAALEGYADTITRARGRIEAYLIERIEHKESARGAIFNLQNNFGWRTKQETSLDEASRKTIETAATMSLADKLELLKSMGLQMPGEETKHDEQTGAGAGESTKTDAV